MDSLESLIIKWNSQQDYYETIGDYGTAEGYRQATNDLKEYLEGRG